ncbi:MAG TPA: hypothetical protein VGM05_16925 [Planctomycetaceae bacterium]|jgi:hypothetical protein
MAELEPGHPDELRQLLTTWLNQSSNPLGSIPEGVTPAEWVIRNFISAWRKPVRAGIDAIESSLKTALDALRAGDTPAAVFEIECSLQTLAESVRDELGIYEWNRESE